MDYNENCSRKGKMTLNALRNRFFGLGGGTPQLHQFFKYARSANVEKLSASAQPRSGEDGDSTGIERQSLRRGVVSVNGAAMRCDEKPTKLNANNIPANDNVRLAMAA